MKLPNLIIFYYFLMLSPFFSIKTMLPLEDGEKVKVKAWQGSIIVAGIDSGSFCIKTHLMALAPYHHFTEGVEARKELNGIVHLIVGKGETHIVWM